MPMPKQTTVHAEVPRGMKAAIRRLAEANKVSTSVVIRWAIQRYFEREENKRFLEQEAA